jgi:2-oxoglutarate/2-oxoacid ferredoxin oxidoreductase subunit beta
VPLIEGAIRHSGAAFIDVVSPCVAFNNHEGSTKSYDYVREHNEAVSRIDFIDLAEPREASPAPGETIDLPQPDGSVMRLRKLHADHDPTDRLAAMNLVQGLAAQGEVATGLIYLQPEASDLHAALNTAATPLNRLDERTLCPGSATLARINDGLK